MNMWKLLQPYLVSSVSVVMLLAILLGINVLGAQWFVRMDLTANRIYSLSDESKALVSNLQDPLVVQGYFSNNLPPAFDRIKRDIEDTLEEYGRHAGSRFQYRSVDPMESPELQEQAANAGIPPVQFESLQSDEYSLREGYAGLVFRYRDRQEVIPIVMNLETLEYDISTRIYRLIRENPDRVVVWSDGTQGWTRQEISQWVSAMESIHTVEFQDPLQAIDPEVGLVIVGGVQEWTEEMGSAVEQYLESGGRVIVFADIVDLDPTSLEPMMVDTGVRAWLAEQGITLGEQVVAQTESGQLRVQSQQGGFTMLQTVNFPLMPLISTAESPETVKRSIAAVQLPFVAPLTPTGADSVTVLLRSTPESWLVAPDSVLSPLVPLQPEQSTMASYPVAIEKQVGVGRLVVLGTSAHIRDGLPTTEENLQWMTNLVDYLTLTEQVGTIRAKQSGSYVLEETTPQARQWIKAANILVMPVFVIGVGVLIWILRRRRTRRMYSVTQ